MSLLLRCSSRLVEKFRSVVDDGRGHSVVIDLPMENGGDDTGPTSLELAVMGLAGCVTTVYALIAAKRRFNFGGIKVEVEAVKPEGEKTLTEVRGKITIWSDNREEAERILSITLENCPVHELFRRANIYVNWSVAITG